MSVGVVVEMIVQWTRFCRYRLPQLVHKRLDVFFGGVRQHDRLAGGMGGA